MTVPAYFYFGVSCTVLEFVGPSLVPLSHQPDGSISGLVVLLLPCYMCRAWRSSLLVPLRDLCIYFCAGFKLRALYMEGKCFALGTPMW